MHYSWEIYFVTAFYQCLLQSVLNYSFHLRLILVDHLCLQIYLLHLHFFSLMK